MFGNNPKKNKDKLEEITKEINSLVEQLAIEKRKQKELVVKLDGKITADEVVDKISKDISDIETKEFILSRVGDSDMVDPRLEPSAIEKLTGVNKELEKNQQRFDQDETESEVIEEQEIELEKQLEDTTRKILDIEARIKRLEAKSKEITLDIEKNYET